MSTVSIARTKLKWQIMRKCYLVSYLLRRRNVYSVTPKKINRLPPMLSIIRPAKGKNVEQTKNYEEKTTNLKEEKLKRRKMFALRRIIGDTRRKFLSCMKLCKNLFFLRNPIKIREKINRVKVFSGAI